MEITEEAVRRRETIGLKDPESAYSEIRDLIERRMNFDHVSEEKYFRDIDKGTVRSKIVTETRLDEHSTEELEIHTVITIGSQELDMQIRGKIITDYELDGRRSVLWRYAYRTLYDKFLYGSVREAHHEDVEETLNEVITRIRQSVEVDH